MSDLDPLASAFFNSPPDATEESKEALAEAALDHQLQAEDAQQLKRMAEEAQAVKMHQQLEGMDDNMPDPFGGQPAGGTFNPEAMVQAIAQLGQGLETCLRNLSLVSEGMATMQNTNEQYRQEFSNINKRLDALEGAQAQKTVGAIATAQETVKTPAAPKPQPKPSPNPVSEDGHLAAERRLHQQQNVRSVDPTKPQINVIDTPNHFGGGQIVQ